MSQPATHIPRMPDFIDSIPSVPAPIEGLCTVCQDTFKNDPEDVVRIFCGHHYHRTCLLGWFASTHHSRNTCPYCRTVLFRMNVLSAEQEAAVAAEAEAEYADAAGIDLQRFTWLMSATDSAFTSYVAGSMSCDIGMITEDLLQQNKAHNFIDGHEVFLSTEHLEAGDDWIRYAVLSRLQDRMLDSDMPIANCVAHDLRGLLDTVTFIVFGYSELSERVRRECEALEVDNVIMGVYNNILMVESPCPDGPFTIWWNDGEAADENWLAGMTGYLDIGDDIAIFYHRRGA